MSIVAWLPGLLIFANMASSLPGAVTFFLFFVILLGPLFAAVWFSGRANVGDEIGGEVSADGVAVSFPARVFLQTSVPPAVKPVASEDPAAYFGG